MAVDDLNQRKRKTEELDAMGRAVAEAVKAGRAPGPCPSPEEIGALAEGRLAEGEADALFGHLALCAECDHTLRDVREMLEERESGKLPVRGRWRGYAVSGLAAAAVLVLAFIFTLSPDHRHAPPQAPGSSARAPAPPAPGLAAPQVEAMRKPTPPDAPRTATPAASSPSFPQQVAQQLALSAGPDVIPQPDAVQGFAGPGNASDQRECYDIGQGLMRVTLALNLRQPDLAAAQVGQLRTLRNGKLLEACLAGFERSLHNGRDGVAAGEELLGCAQRALGERSRYLAAGVWAEAARMSATSGQREYFHSPAFARQTATLLDSGLPATSAAIVGRISAVAAEHPLSESGLAKIIRLTAALRDSF